MNTFGFCPLSDKKFLHDQIFQVIPAYKPQIQFGETQSMKRLKSVPKNFAPSVHFLFNRFYKRDHFSKRYIADTFLRLKLKALPNHISVTNLIPLIFSWKWDRILWIFSYQFRKLMITIGNYRFLFWKILDLKRSNDWYTGSGSEIVTPLRLSKVSKPVGISGWKFYKIIFKPLSSYDYKICFVQNSFINELLVKGK